jgi:hypothetical protein
LQLLLGATGSFAEPLQASAWYVTCHPSHSSATDKGFANAEVKKELTFLIRPALDSDKISGEADKCIQAE